MKTAGNTVNEIVPRLGGVAPRQGKGINGKRMHPTVVSGEACCSGD